ncbi:hypothetical protein LBO01_25220 [Companilactobacillus paralimentarius]|nr:hypothetical protein LBO01_25220 [Companilactobacillus paralimentarius]
MKSDKAQESGLWSSFPLLNIEQWLFQKRTTNHNKKKGGISNTTNHRMKFFNDKPKNARLSTFYHK